MSTIAFFIFIFCVFEMVCRPTTMVVVKTRVLIHTGLTNLPHGSSTNSIHEETPPKLPHDQKSHYSNFVTSLLASHVHDSPTKKHPGCLLYVMLSEAKQRKLFCCCLAIVQKNDLAIVKITLCMPGQ